MSFTFSLYLDLVRFLAAAAVVLFHSNSESLLYACNIPLTDYGHEAVIVFFVLSGYVIGYITDTKERVLSQYFISRAARIYSVAVPAIILTLVLDNIGLVLSPALYLHHTMHTDMA